MNNTLTIVYTLTNDSLYYAIVSIASLFINNKDNNINLLKLILLNMIILKEIYSFLNAFISLNCQI